MAAITCRAYARIGLLGNPSGAARGSNSAAQRTSRRAALTLRLLTFAGADGYNGKTIALSLETYYAEARRGRRGARARRVLAGRRG
jgi:hypothetical protein